MSRLFILHVFVTLIGLPGWAHAQSKDDVDQAADYIEDAWYDKSPLKHAGPACRDAGTVHLSWTDDRGRVSYERVDFRYCPERFRREFIAKAREEQHKGRMASRRLVIAHVMAAYFPTTGKPSENDRAWKTFFWLQENPDAVLKALENFQPRD